MRRQVKDAVETCYLNRFGRLVVTGWTDGPGRVLMVARCDCGNEIKTRARNLLTGTVKSCGCYQADELGDRRRTHGMSQSRTYHVWQALVQRCTNPKNKDWGDYGGRGITVSERWLNFENFFADVGEIPEGVTLDREDNSMGYSNSNWRLATWVEQANNRRPRGCGRKAQEKA